jgi:hypothetical protein
LGGRDLKAAEFLHDLGDSTSAYTLYIDACNGGF